MIPPGTNRSQKRSAAAISGVVLFISNEKVTDSRDGHLRERVGHDTPDKSGPLETDETLKDLFSDGNRILLRDGNPSPPRSASW
jgi:hypothetical protein